MNDKGFDDRERTLENIKYLFFYTFGQFVSPMVISYYDFLFLMIYRLLIKIKKLKKKNFLYVC
jgi:hypothetical protein